MILKDIINKSYYGSVGYISNLDDISRLEQYIIYNLSVLKEFINIVTSTTYIDDNPELRIQLETTWKKYFPNSIHIDTGISRGHSFGAADNDNTIIDYCKNNNLQMVVVSHHCPTYSVLGQNYHKKEKYLSLYVSNLDHLLDKNNIHTWVCGHIHKNFDFITENGTRIVGNQKGKPKDRIHDFLRDYVIQV